MIRRIPKPVLYVVVVAVLACIGLYTIPKSFALTIPGIGLTISRGTDELEDNNGTNSNGQDNTVEEEDNTDGSNHETPGNTRSETPDEISNKEISRAEFAKALCKTFIYVNKEDVSLSDIDDSDAKEEIQALVGAGVMSSYQDNTFRPEQPITRGEAISALVKAAKLDSLLVDTTDLDFVDITPDNIYAEYVKIADYLGLLPWKDVKFSPSKAVLHKEGEYMLDAVKALTSVKGTITALDLDTNTLTISNENEENENVHIQNDTVVFKNAVVSGITNLNVDDNIVAIITADGTAKHITAVAELPENVVGELAGLLEYFLSPDQIKSLVTGDYSSARTKVEQELKAQLEGYGLQEEEINSLLEQDWDALRSQGEDRVTETLAQNLELPKEVIEVIMQQDWNKLLAFAQVQLAEQAINQLIQNS